MFGFQALEGLKNKQTRQDSARELQPQEILLDSLSRKKEFLSQKRFEVLLKNKVLRVFTFIFLVLILILFTKTLELQAIKSREFIMLAQRNYQRVYFDNPVRGVIYDKDFNQLAFNKLRFDLACYKKDLPQGEKEKEKVLRSISEILSIDVNVLRNKLSEETGEHILISEDLDHDTLILLYSRLEDLPGFYLNKTFGRSYASSPNLSHVLGFLGRVESFKLKEIKNYSGLDYIGKSGLEKSYEEILRGKRGETMVVKNVFSQEISREKISDPQPGESLVLWIDSDLQARVNQILGDAMNKVSARGGVVIAMDPNTGGVLSLVSLPNFDNNLFFGRLDPKKWEQISTDSSTPLWNRCISGIYPTGSTIKPIIAIAALEEEIIKAGEKINCQGSIDVPNPWFPDKPWVFHDWTIHGWTDLRKAIAQSCNVYFYTVGGGYRNIKGLGEEKIKQYLELFGWGRKTGIDLPDEKKGLIPDRKWKEEYFREKAQRIWLPGDTYNLSIGQGYLSVTPIQVVASFSAIANGGKLLSPRLVKEIVDENKNTVEKLQPEIIRENFVDQNYIKAVKEGMKQAVNYGTGRHLSDLPVEVAAKTGTAQTSEPDHYHNWITVFAPYENPEIVLTVMLESVPEEQMAAISAARDILAWYFRE